MLIFPRSSWEKMPSQYWKPNASPARSAALLCHMTATRLLLVVMMEWSKCLRYHLARCCTASRSTVQLSGPVHSAALTTSCCQLLMITQPRFVPVRVTIEWLRATIAILSEIFNVRIHPNFASQPVWFEKMFLCCFSLKAGRKDLTNRPKVLSPHPPPSNCSFPPENSGTEGEGGWGWG